MTSYKIHNLVCMYVIDCIYTADAYVSSIDFFSFLRTNKLCTYVFVYTNVHADKGFVYMHHV